MKTVLYFLKLFVIIFATLFALSILFRLVTRLPGVVVALSVVSIMIFSLSYYKGGIRAIGLQSRKASGVAIIASILLLIISIAILVNIQ